MIDPRKPDYGKTPVSPARPGFAYAPREAGADAAPLVTIATAFYNTGEVFRETARCVFAQSLQAWEWVIVNDGSTDKAALAMLDEFRRIDPRVRVVDHDKNRGLSAARNTGFREARSGYVYQLDSDDLIEPTALEKCLWYMHTHPEAAFVSSYIVGFEAQEYLWTKGFHHCEEFLKENLATPMGIVRRGVFDEVGEYDEDNRGGMEDWEFWLRCASRGHWGETIPEYLGWYRRREQHWDSWANMRAEERRQGFHDRMMDRFGRRLQSEFPRIVPRHPMPFDDVRIEPGLANPLAKKARRLLLIAPWLTLGGADKFNVAMVRELVSRGWEVTVATTLAGDNSWLPEFTALTPDVFVAPHFLRTTDIPAFLRYLIESRSPDAVMVSNSELGYHVLPYLRAYCPAPAYVDLSHMEEPWWKNGGHPRYGAGSQSQLDLNIVVSEHLKDWQASRGADPARIEVCYVSACEDSEHWKRDAVERARVRHGLEIGPEEPVILYAGRIVEQKRPRVFARVMESLATAGVGFTCLVAGDGPDMAWLRGFVHEKGLGERVRLLGAVPHGQMHELMSASDIFFLPSMWEGIAISIYEAMSMDLAVVGAAVGGQAELVREDCGVLVARGEEESEIVEYVAALAGMLRDPVRARRMGQRARTRVRDGFEPRHMGDRMVELLAQAERLRKESPRQAVDPAFAVECAVRGVEYLRAWDNAEHNYHLQRRLTGECEALRRERAELARERDRLLAERARLTGESMGVHVNGNGQSPQVIVAARQIIEENFRYTAVDRINTALKSMGLQAPIKALTIRVFGTSRNGTHKG